MRRWADDMIGAVELRERIERRAALRRDRVISISIGILIGALVMALPWLTLITN